MSESKVQMPTPAERLAMAADKYSHLSYTMPNLVANVQRLEAMLTKARQQLAEAQADQEKWKQELIAAAADCQ